MMNTIISISNKSNLPVLLLTALMVFTLPSDIYGFQTSGRSINFEKKEANPRAKVDTEMKATDKVFAPVPQITFEARQMNVLFVGVNNPIFINANGFDPSTLKVSISGGGNGTISKGIGEGMYIVNVQSPTSNMKQCIIEVEANGQKFSKEYRVKRIPNPVAKLSNKSGGVMSMGEFKAQVGVIAMLENFDFDARCKVVGFEIVHVPYEGQAIDIVNREARFDSQAKALIVKAKPGDRYLFEDIKCKCPGDKAPRVLNNMSFQIK